MTRCSRLELAEHARFPAVAPSEGRLCRGAEGTPFCRVDVDHVDDARKALQGAIDDEAGHAAAVGIGDIRADGSRETCDLFLGVAAVEQRMGHRPSASEAERRPHAVPNTVWHRYVHGCEPFPKAIA